MQGPGCLLEGPLGWKATESSFSLSLFLLHPSSPTPVVPLGGTPPLKATSSATVFVNLLDLNDNDPTFQNLPFVSEVLEGTPAGVSVYQVSFPFMARDPALCHLLTSPTCQPGNGGCCVCPAS